MLQSLQLAWCRADALRRTVQTRYLIGRADPAAIIANMSCLVTTDHLLDLTADIDLIPTDVSEDNGCLENIMTEMSAPQRRRRW
jgi:hypothetical protein